MNDGTHNVSNHSRDGAPHDAAQRTSATIASERPAALVILGHPVAQSMSPVFQGAALHAAGIGCEYARRDVPPESLDAVLAECAAARIGGNVTMPHKNAVAERASRLSEVARRAGAVNTFWFERGALVGHNTDVDGARATIAALAPAGGHDRVVMLGAGGAAGAVVLALESLGVAHVAIAARTPPRAEALLVSMGATGTVLADHDAQLDEWLATASLVINATPRGMKDDTFPVDLARLGRDTAVFDLVYRRGGTAWMRAARAAGHWAEDGLRMLVEQGAAAFTCWFGVAPDRRVMWDALDSAPPTPRTP